MRYIVITFLFLSASYMCNARTSADSIAIATESIYTIWLQTLKADSINKHSKGVFIVESNKILKSLSTEKREQLQDFLKDECETEVSIDKKLALLFIQFTVLRLSGKAIESVEAIDEFIALAEKNDSKLHKALGYYYKAIILYRGLNRRDHEALLLMIKAESIYNTIDRPIQQFMLHRLLASYHYEYGDESKAIDYFNKALSHTKVDAHHVLIIDSWNGIGLVYRKQQKYDTAISFFKKAIAVAKQYNNKRWIAILQGNIGTCFYLKKDFHQAIPLLQKDLISSRKVGDKKSQVNLLKTFADIYLQKNELDSAYIFLKEAETLLNGMLYKDRLAEVYNLLATVSELKKDYKIAIKYHHLKESTLDSLEMVYYLNKKNSKDVNRIYNLLDRKQEIANAKSSSFYFNLTIIIVCLITGLFLIFTFYVLRKGKNTENQLNEYHQVVLQQKKELEKVNYKLSLESEEVDKKFRKVFQIFNEYAYTNAHIIRGPITRILGMIQLWQLGLLNKKETSEMKELLCSEVKELDKITKELGYKIHIDTQEIKTSDKIKLSQSKTLINNRE